MKKKGGDTRAKAAANGNTVGRRPKPKILATAEKSVATGVLAMNGPPFDHRRLCKCEACTEHRENKCKCIKVHDQALPEECQQYAEHCICHCEVCGWWEGLLATEKRLRIETRRYLTDRRDGKPAESIIAEGKLEITVREIGGDSSTAETGAAEETV